MSESHEQLRWWGEFEIPPGRAGRWRIGALTIWVEHLEHEWRLAWEEAKGEAADETVEVVCPAEPGEVPETATVERVAWLRPDGRLIVTPRLADRPIVSRPEIRFRLAGGGEVDLYVGHPLWVRFETAEPSRRLLEIPIRRPSDTWFGPSTLEGELCYASRTKARLRLENVAPEPSWGLTEVRLRNRAKDDLVLERINLPVPNLALFADVEHRLWTQSVSVERDADGKLAEVRIGAGPPAQVASAERVSGPRQEGAQSVFSRALEALLG